MIQYLFYFLSFIVLASAAMVVIAKNPVHSVLYLVLTLFGVACHYILLNAQFLFAVQVIVYAGAIMVLFLFVIMLLNLNEASETVKSPYGKLISIIAFGLLLITLVGALRSTAESPVMELNDTSIGLVKNLGIVLFRDFLLPFEMSSILLLSAMVGAVLLAKKEKAKA